jgi:Tol biopolymer transport system component
LPKTVAALECQNSAHTDRSPGIAGGTREHDGSPLWSPDGSRIAFDRQIRSPEGPRYGLFVLDLDTLHTRLVADPIDPFGTSWSPDGKWLAYERDGDIYAVDVDGGEPLQVTAGPEEDGMPVWQPTKEQAGS